MNKKAGFLSKSGLAVVLSKLEGFKEPKVMVEQYIMDSETGASVLWNAALLGDIKQKVSVDLGCGTGILGIGALILGAKRVYFVDSDQEALEKAKENWQKVKSEGLAFGEAIFLCQDITGFNEKVDVVFENPPFGTKVRHADRGFLERALSLAAVVYSFHKSESKNFIGAFARDKNYEVSHIWDFKFPLKATQRFHTRKIHRIDVSCFRLEGIYRRENRG